MGSPAVRVRKPHVYRQIPFLSNLTGESSDCQHHHTGSESNTSVQERNKFIQGRRNKRSSAALHSAQQMNSDSKEFAA
ncbi:Hypothetical protein SMAX5B_012407 [Scophthalmus maximus]|uniref:Uncharacterized protein n=1 Tax=Scophthalmus maximus TaxID=52904 RepID=A0A2U9BCA0_SCOMX|nr:Hypothetical protein SMAX5B_012407 [Scophthalmus maximus]KAF0043197.1 hypothetical protein F2P81_004534 [Scophthalmus maximus]